jgi:hypothetical protein
MPEPLDYCEATSTNPPAGDEPSHSPTRGAMTIGIIVFVICTAVMFLPLVIPLGQLAKFVVTPAFVGACIGLSITANASIDWWRGGKGTS